MNKLDKLLDLKHSLIKNIGVKINNKEVVKIQILPCPIGTYDHINDVSLSTLMHLDQNKIPLGIFYILKDNEGKNHWQNVSY